MQDQINLQDLEKNPLELAGDVRLLEKKKRENLQGYDRTRSAQIKEQMEIAQRIASLRIYEEKLKQSVRKLLVIRIDLETEVAKTKRNMERFVSMEFQRALDKNIEADRLLSEVRLKQVREEENE